MMSLIRLKTIAFAVILICNGIASAQVTSSSNGDYSNNSSWIGNAPNSSNVDILILNDLILDVSITIKKDFEIQGSLVGTSGETIEVKTSGVLTIGNLNIDETLTISGSGQLNINAGDTVYLDNLLLSGSAIVVIESNAVVYIDADFEVKNTVDLTIQSGAEVYVGNDFILTNSTTPVIDGDIFVTNEFITKNSVTITGNGSIAAGSQTQINNSSSVFGSTTTCFNCVYSNGCSYNSTINTWTGAVNNDWFNPANWTNGIPLQDAQINIPVSSIPIISGVGAKCFHLIIESGATLEIADGDSLSIYGDITVNGSLISNTSILNFTGDCWPTKISAADTVRLHSLVVSNINNVVISSGIFELSGDLTVQNGTFNTNDSLILISDATGTARIDEITGGGSIVGEIEMQRYIDAGETYWRFLSSAVQGATVADYQGDFITSGYVGSDFPSFPFTSVYTYDEGTGYVGVSNANQVINQGEGLMVWSGDTITGTDPFVVDYRGVPNQGDINMLVTFTPTDGWNLVGNPYASTIDWDLITGLDRQNMANAIYILNPDTEQYATYINGASANGGSNLIASQQSFWVGAIASSPVLTIKESHKSSVDQAFFKAGSAISSGVHIVLSGNNKTDEAVLRHVENATDGYDSEFDATKKFASWMEYPHVSILNAANEDFTVHSFDKSFQEWSLPIRTIVFQNGDYNLVFNDLTELDVPCIKLEDTYDGQMYDVQDGIPMTFTMSDTTYLPRFILHLGKNYEVEAIEALCNGDFGAVSIGLDSLENGTYDLVTGGTVSSGTFNGNLQINSLAAGNYSIAMNGLNNLCQSNQFNFHINEPLEIVMDATVSPEISGNDGSIITNVSGGTPWYSYLWSTGDTIENLTDLTIGEYELTVIDNNGCAKTSTFELLSVLGVDEIVTNEVEFLYFSDQNKIRLSGNLESYYSLNDMTGKILKEFIIDKNTSLAEIVIPSNLSKGVYMLTGIKNSYKILK